MDLNSLNPTPEELSGQVEELFSDEPSVVDTEAEVVADPPIKAEEVVEAAGEKIDENQDAPILSEGTDGEAEAEPAAVVAAADEQVANPVEAATEVSETALLKAQIEEMRTAIAIMQVTGQPVQQAPTPAPQTQMPEEIAFVTGDDAHTDILSDPKAFNAILNKVYQASLETTYRNVMPVVNQVVAESLEVHSRARNFYDDNPDLAVDPRIKGLVAQTADGIQKANPGMNLDQVLQETSKQVRQRLNMPKPVAQVRSGVQAAAAPVAPKPPAARPAFATPNTTRRPLGQAKGVTDLEAEIAELLEF